jgi:hypothetical protein
MTGGRTRELLPSGDALPVVAAATVVLVPVATAQACARSPRDAAARYYQGIDDARYTRAWRCLSTATRAEFGGYSRWRAGYRGLVSTSLTFLRLVDQAAGTAVMSVALRSCRRVGNGVLAERFSGRWEALNGYAGWRLHDPRIRRSSARRHDDC